MKPHLSDRLRYFDARIGSPIAVEAADRLEALERENAELCTERDAARASRDSWKRTSEQQTARAEAAERRVAELKAERPLTVEMFAECLETVWNAALGESHRRQEGAAFAAILAEATAAMARRAREYLESSTKEG